MILKVILPVRFGMGINVYIMVLMGVCTMNRKQLKDKIDNDYLRIERALCNRQKQELLSRLRELDKRIHLIDTHFKMREVKKNG